jgi:hypothetical protein
MTNANPTPDLSDHLARLVYELLDAHYDTARLAEDLPEDERWHAHLAYLRDLQRVAREVLATATADDEACERPPLIVHPSALRGLPAASLPPVPNGSDAARAHGPGPIPP